MIGRVILAVLLAGIAAGIVMGFIQHVRLTPLILEAETYEVAEGGHEAAAPAVAAAPDASGQAADEAGTGQAQNHNAHDLGSHDHGDAEWKPGDGLERTLDTSIATIIQGVAFAAVLAGLSFLIGIPINRANGMIWGLCGFLAATLATSAGLAPELPGMPAADLTARQIWWIGTAVATGAGIYLLAVRRELWAICVAIILIGLPHVVGAPMPEDAASKVPAELAATFAANSSARSASSLVTPFATPP